MGCIKMETCTKKSTDIFQKYSTQLIYILTNLGYTIGCLVIDTYLGFSTTLSDIYTAMKISNDSISILDQPIMINVYVNQVDIGLATINILVVFVMF
ncbi:unnamed protein product [Rotaria sp. Silwood1]|nr:unnamed protein product [Rotaria sp. Silwood1]CAF3762934.1 unnamed protein product [Rotaria sp. Silwood1]CAF3806494.1 unnamed protein product [Rotaria sp. Silwood1]CAF3883603.1 unnamed protein product [Rotaria sp. Silwood1]CAF5163801.1 unnamed protein product [Rotaria sp. Silwood1]